MLTKRNFELTSTFIVASRRDIYLLLPTFTYAHACKVLLLPELSPFVQTEKTFGQVEITDEVFVHFTAIYHPKTMYCAPLQ